MAVYDEDILKNPFYLSIQKQQPDLFNQVADLHGIVLVPCKGSLSSRSISSLPFDDYVLKPVDERFQTLNGKEVSVQGNLVKPGKGFASTDTVPILFEETFYNDKEESYSIWCIGRPLESDKNPDEQSIQTNTYCLKNLEDVKEFLGRHTDKLTKQIASFCSTFKERERKGLRHQIDCVNALYTKCLQTLLRDSRLKTLVKQELQMNLLKQAVEIYVHHCIYDILFKYVGTIEASEDAAFNKITRSVQDLQQKDLGVKSDFCINIPRAKRELSQLNRCTSPQQKLFCLKRVVQTVMQSPSQRVTVETMCADDLLPVLLYLLVKTEIPNWMANLSYIKNFRITSSVQDELGYCLTSFEAAVEYIRQGNLLQDQTGPGELNDKLFLRQRLNLLSQMSTTPIDCLFEHIAFGNEEEVERLLSQGENDEDNVQKMCHPLCSCDSCEKLVSGKLNDPSIVTPLSRDDRGYTPLHIAAICGRASLIDMLVSRGAVVNATEYHGSTPLHLACQKGYQSVALLLLHYQASTDAADNNGNTPLHLACTYGHEDCVKALVYYDIYSCRVGIMNDKGDTPLHIAARWGYEGIIHVLLENGADVNIQNKMKETPLQCALNSKILTIMEVDYKRFERRSSVFESPNRSPQRSAGTSSKRSSISTASSLSLDVVPVIDKDKYKEVEKLLRAAADGDTEMVRYLLQWMEDDLDDDDDNDVDHVFKPEFCHPLCQCPRCEPAQKRLAAVPQNGLGVNISNEDGFTPLHVAALHGHTELVSLLLRHGANICLKTANHATPLHLACQNSHIQVVKCLLECSAKLNKKDQFGNTPLIISCLKGSCEIAVLLLESGAFVNIANNQGNTALHEAVKGCHLHLVELLLFYGASVHIRNKRQYTPLDCAEEMCGKHTDILKALQKAVSYTSEMNEDEDPFTTERKQQTPIRRKPPVFLKQLQTTHDSESRRLAIVDSISRFNKSKCLRKTITRDKSVPNFDEALLHQLAIKTFDKRKLKSTMTLDRSKPQLTFMRTSNESAQRIFDEAIRKDKLQDRRHSFGLEYLLEHNGKSTENSRSHQLEDCTISNIGHENDFRDPGSTNAKTDSESPRINEQQLQDTGAHCVYKTGTTHELKNMPSGLLHQTMAQGDVDVLYMDCTSDLESSWSDLGTPTQTDCAVLSKQIQ